MALESLYNLELGETLIHELATYLRVPGGWIYESVTSTRPVFIPFVDERPKQKPPVRTTIKPPKDNV